MADIRQQYEDFEHIKTLRGRFWKTIATRSPFSRIHTQQILTSLRNAGWRCTDAIVAKITEQWDGVSNTKIVEDAARELREEETNRNFKKSLASSRAWGKLIKKRIESTKHRFRSLRWRSQVVKKRFKTKSMRNLFEAKPRNCPNEFRKIVSEKRNAPYFTSAPLNQSLSVQDQALIRFCRQHGLLEKGPESWKCIVPGQCRSRILIRSPLVDNNQWFLCLGASGTVAKVIPVTPLQHQSKFFRAPQDHRQHHFLSDPLLA